MKIAAILTCFNRKDKTDKCLNSLFRIIPDCDAYVTDDNSTDGTTEMICKKYPQTTIIKGTGRLFWSRGMYTAWKEALKEKYDYYLWLNDDVELYPFFWEELMLCNQLGTHKCIVTGLIETFDKTEILYGGTDAYKRLLGESEQPQEVTNMNGNVVLVPQSVVDEIGIIDPVFHHDLGDIDYGLTAIKHNIKVLTTRRAVAAGDKNHFCRVRKWGTTLRQRLKKLHSPLGSPPYINFYFRKKHYGIANATIYFLYLYAINFMPDWMVENIWGNAYKDKWLE